MQCLSRGPVSLRSERVAQLPHVLLVVDGFPRVLGGGERVALRLAALLPEYGYRVSLLTFAFDPQGELDASAAPCPLYLLPLRSTYDLAAWRGALALGRFLNDEQVRVVQTFFESSDLWAGFFTRVFSSAKLVWSRRDLGILRGSKHNLAYRAFRHLPHAVFAVSDEVRRHAATVDRIPAERLRTIHNGLEITASRHPSRTLHPIRKITTVGNVRRVKGHDLLVRAAAEVVRQWPETSFNVAGEVLDPAYFAELQNLIGELGLTEHFKFLGRATDVSAHLATADLFVLPSRSEGFSNALIEAMAAGLPVIATDVGGNAEAVQPGISGLIVPPEDASALAAAMLLLMSSPEKAQAMGAAGRASVERHFTAAAMTRKVSTEYAALLASA